MIVDAHTHAAQSWFEPVEALLFQMDRCGVERAVLVQMFGQYDNGYQIACARQHPDRLVAVGQVDPAAPDVVAQLERLREDGAVGVRMRPELRSPGDDPLLIWRTAARLGLAISCGAGGDVYLSDDFAAVLRAVGDAPVAIEHLGAFHRDGASVEAIAPKLAHLASFPNLTIKIHGLGQFATRAMPAPSGDDPFVRPVPPLLEAVVSAFGPSRVMWGSEYPAVSAKEGYANALRLPMAQLAGLSSADRDLVFGGTAARVLGRPLARHGA